MHLEETTQDKDMVQWKNVYLLAIGVIELILLFT